MSKRISIGSTYAETWYILSWVATGAFLIIALIVAGVSKDLQSAAILVGIAVLFAMLALIRGLGIAKRRRWLTSSKSGFVLEDRRGEYEFDDDVITDLGTWVTMRFSNGNPSGVTRQGTLFIQADEYASRLEFKYSYGLNEEDPLGPFIERNIARITEIANTALNTGGEVTGDNWVLDREGLTYEEKGEERTVSLAKLSAVEVIDGKVCIWKTGETLPIVKIPAPSANALVLGRILLKRLEGQAVQETEEDGTLGRLIFERDKSLSKTMLILICSLAALFVMMAVAVSISSLKGNPREPALIFVGIGLLIFAGLMIFASLYFRTNIFRCHNFGVCRITTRGEKSIRFKDVRIFTYSAIRNYYNGAYTGTIVSLKFESLKAERVTYSATFKNADDEIDNLREHVSRVIAQHMLNRLKDGKTVQWTDRVRFTLEGLEIAGKSGLFGKSDDLFVPYAKIVDAQLSAGNFALIAEGRKKPVYETAVSAPNFFPGYVLLVLIRFTPGQQQVNSPPENSQQNTSDKPPQARRPRDDFNDE